MTRPVEIAWYSLRNVAMDKRDGRSAQGTTGTSHADLSERSHGIRALSGGTATNGTQVLLSRPRHTDNESTISRYSKTTRMNTQMQMNAFIYLPYADSRHSSRSCGHT